MINNTYASFEIGHKNWKFMVTTIDNSKIKIAYSKIGISTKLFMNNKLVNPKLAAEILDKQILLANAFLQINLVKVVYVIPSTNLEIHDTQVTTNFDNLHIINEHDIKVLKRKVQHSNHHNLNYCQVNHVDNYYLIDNHDQYNYMPLNRAARSLTYFAKTYYMPKNILQNYLSIFNYTNKASLLKLVLDAFACSYGVSKHANEKQNEIIAIDYGNKNIKINYMFENKILQQICLPNGSYQVDSDIEYFFQNQSNLATKNFKLNFCDWLSLNNQVQNQLKVNNKKFVNNVKKLDFTSNEITLIQQLRIEETLGKVFKVMHNFNKNCSVQTIFAGGITRLDSFVQALNTICRHDLPINVYQGKHSEDNASLANVYGACIYLHIYNLENNLKYSSVKNNFTMIFTNRWNFKIFTKSFNHKKI